MRSYYNIPKVRFNPYTAFDFFERKPGSKQWPSTDPNDSPFDTFTCKFCGAPEKIQMFGMLHTDDEPFENMAEKRLEDHLSICKVYLAQDKRVGK